MPILVIHGLLVASTKHHKCTAWPVPCLWFTTRSRNCCIVFSRGTGITTLSQETVAGVVGSAMGFLRREN